MRGQVDPQSQMFSYFSPESRVPAEHPLRGIKIHTDRVLQELSGQIDALYADTGRPSIPPERLLKAQLLIALYSVRSDRLFCQMLDYNILFRWFLGVYPGFPMTFSSVSSQGSLGTGMRQEARVKDAHEG